MVVRVLSNTAGSVRNVATYLLEPASLFFCHGINSNVGRLVLTGRVQPCNNGTTVQL